MFDITPVEHSFAQDFYSATLYIALLLGGCAMSLYGAERERGHRIGTCLLFSGLLLYCLTGFMNGDYYHYWQYVQRQVNYTVFSDTKALEIFYQRLILATDKNYLLFRLLVWGPACVLYALTVRRLGVSLGHALLPLIACHVLIFSYARATLGMAVVFFGYSLFLNPYRGMRLWQVAGVLIMLAAPAFHRSMYGLIALVALGHFLPMNKRTVIAMLCLFPVVVALASVLLSDYLTALFLDETIVSKATRYAEAEGKAANWKGMLQNILQYSTFYLPVLMAIVRLDFKGLREQCAPTVFAIHKTAFVIVLAATALLFVIKGSIIYYRFLYMSMIPVSIIMTGLADRRLIPMSWYKTVLLLGVLYNLQVILYAFSRSIGMA